MRSTFIKFTTHTDHNPVWINIDLVESFNAGLHTGTTFYYESEKLISVTESLAEVEQRLLKVSKHAHPIR